jgi:MFS family permease
VDCTTPILALIILIIFGLFIGGMVAGAFTASLCIAPDLSGTIESAAGFMAILAMILSANTAGLINQTVIFFKRWLFINSGSFMGEKGRELLEKGSRWYLEIDQKMIFQRFKTRFL